MLQLAHVVGLLGLINLFLGFFINESIIHRHVARMLAVKDGLVLHITGISAELFGHPSLR